MHHGEHMLEDVMTKKSAFLFCSGCVAMLLASLLAAPQGFAQQQQQQEHQHKSHAGVLRLLFRGVTA